MGAWREVAVCEFQCVTNLQGNLAGAWSNGWPRCDFVAPVVICECFFCCIANYQNDWRIRINKDGYLILYVFVWCVCVFVSIYVGLCLCFTCSLYLSVCLLYSFCFVSMYWVSLLCLCILFHLFFFVLLNWPTCFGLCCDLLFLCIYGHIFEFGI